MEQENREFRAKVEEQQKQLRMQQAQQGPVPSTVPVPTRAGEDGSVAASSVEGWSASAEAHVSSTESLARQQLMAELREASNLMAESVTPEAAQFWRNHVVDLQSRLRALHSGSPAPGNQPRTSATAEELMESNRRLMEKYETPEEPARPPSQSYPPTNIYPPGQGTHTHEQQQSRSLQPAPGSTSNPPQQPAPERPRQKPSYPDRSLPMVDVVAPADLPGGYHFEAEIEGRRFLATVPQGGVRRGETFSCAMRSLETVGADVPVGRWRDRICDFGSHGLCHPVILNTIFCPFRECPFSPAGNYTQDGMSFVLHSFFVRFGSSACAHVYTVPYIFLFSLSHTHSQKTHTPSSKSPPILASVRCLHSRSWSGDDAPQFGRSWTAKGIQDPQHHMGNDDDCRFVLGDHELSHLCIVRLEAQPAHANYVLRLRCIVHPKRFRRFPPRVRYGINPWRPS